jgi:hypothetical protein
VQIPIAAAGALAARRAVPGERESAPVQQEQIHADPARRGMGAADALALALVSAALTAVLFGLVLLLIAGWAVEPLAAAATVTVLPVAAIAGAQVRARPRKRAIAGSLLVGGGVLALAWLPSAAVAWTIPPQALAGIGMGMALPAFAGELLPERGSRDAARLLTVRHAGIALVLIALAPLIAHRLDVVTERAQERGVALVLDARLPPQDKLSLAPALLSGVEAERPRAGLRRALASHGGHYSGEQRVAYDTLASRADETLVSAVGDAFRWAFLLAGALALLAAGLLALAAAGDRRRVAGALVTAAAALALVVPAAYAGLHAIQQPAPVTLANPCEPRPLPKTGGFTGFLQDRALQALDAAACRYGSTREELVLALANDKAADRFHSRHGVNPRSVGSLLQGLLSP